MQSWLFVNRLSLNIKKSSVLLVGSRQKLRNHDLSITIDGRQLSHVSSIRYLGLYIAKTSFMLQQQEKNAIHLQKIVELFKSNNTDWQSV